jgi:hypothetical protein
MLVKMVSPDEAKGFAAADGADKESTLIRALFAGGAGQSRKSPRVARPVDRRGAGRQLCAGVPCGLL